MGGFLTEEQSLLQRSISGFLDSRYRLDARQKPDAGDGWQPEIWHAFAQELGVLGVAIPRSLGGFCGSAKDVGLVMEQLGQALVIEPFLQTAVIASGFLVGAQCAVGEALLDGIVAGSAIFAFAQAEPQSRFSLRDIRTTATRTSAGWRLDGLKSVVVAAPLATHFIVTARTGGEQWADHGVSVFAVPANVPGIELQSYSIVDGRRAADVRFHGVEIDRSWLIGEEHNALPLVEKVVDRALAALAAECVGCMRSMLDQTIAYALQRRQFGQPIGNFQVLQHRMVDMYMAIEETAALASLAAEAIDNQAADQAAACAAAKVKAGEAARFVGQSAIQIHGGMGMTDELAIGHYFRRTTTLENEFGSTDYHLSRYTDLIMPKMS